MPTPRKKYLIETSAVRSALAESTRAHCLYFAEEVQDGDLWTSTYIRMEYIRLWVCQMIEIALTIDQSTDVADALYLLEQEFSIRKVKADIASIANYVRQNGSISNSRSAAEDIGSAAVQKLRRFDTVFRSRINSRSGCRKGTRDLQVDYNRLLLDLHKFHESFREPVTDCEVTAWLRLQNPESQAAKLISHARTAGLPIVKHLAEIRDSAKPMTCTGCAAIGDIIIALEQPRGTVLVHIDGVFNNLCESVNRPHKHLKSVPAIAKLTKGNTSQQQAS